MVMMKKTGSMKMMSMEIILIFLMMKMICSFFSYVYQKTLRLTFGVFHSFTKRIKIAFPFHINLFYSYDQSCLFLFNVSVMFCILYP